MVFFLEMRFEDNGYRAIVHFATTLITNSDGEAKIFLEELEASMQRAGLRITSISCNRIDNNPVLRENYWNYYQFYIKRATAKIDIDQYVLQSPDQAKTLSENVMDKFLNGENSTAYIGNRYSIPVRVMDKVSREPIAGDIYYLNLQHLIPKS